MWQVNIYLEVSSKRPPLSERHSGVVLEYQKKNGELETREYFFTRKATYNQTVLQDLIKGLQELNISCDLCIHTENTYVALGVKRLSEMMAAGFLNSKGKPIKNQEEWIQIHNLAKEHIITVSTEKHSYSGWMREQMKTFPIKQGGPEPQGPGE